MTPSVPAATPVLTPAERAIDDAYRTLFALAGETVLLVPMVVA